MGRHETDFTGDVCGAIREAVLEKIPDAAVEVEQSRAGHFTLTVTAAVFATGSMLEQQRLVYGAIAHLMKGQMAPVHAIDRLVTRAP